MPTDFSTIDLATLKAAQGVMVAALRDCCSELMNLGFASGASVDSLTNYYKTVDVAGAVV